MSNGEIFLAVVVIAAVYWLISQAMCVYENIHTQKKCCDQNKVKEEDGV